MRAALEKFWEMLEDCKSLQNKHIELENKGEMIECLRNALDTDRELKLAESKANLKIETKAELLCVNY